MMQLYLDFDGTLIDSRPRQYRLFCELAPACKLTFENYWHIKRQRFNQGEMLRRYCGYEDSAIPEFHKNWMQEIESPTRLDEDTPLPEVDAFLRRAAMKHSLILVTARQEPTLVAKQLNKFGWTDLFAQVLVTKHRSSKEALIRTSCPPVSTAIMVGDTGEDVIAGKALNITTVAVSSGVLNAEVLREYAPDFLFDSVIDLSLPE